MSFQKKGLSPKRRSSDLFLHYFKSAPCFFEEKKISSLFLPKFTLCTVLQILNCTVLQISWRKYFVQQKTIAYYSATEIYVGRETEMNWPLGGLTCTD